MNGRQTAAGARLPPAAERFLVRGSAAEQEGYPWGRRA